MSWEIILGQRFRNKHCRYLSLAQRSNVHQSHIVHLNRQNTSTPSCGVLFAIMAFRSTSIFRLLFSACSLVALVASYTPLEDATLKSLRDPGADFDINEGELLAPILRVRVSGTEGNTAVQHHFKDYFHDYLPKWNLEMQNSTSTTPTSDGKEIPFTNIIFYRDPPWTRPGDAGRLTLVAHFDSKLTPEGFIGAVDSAAPCAMLMYLARELDTALTKKWEGMLAEGKYTGLEEEKGIQILFLDGEEAFKSWTSTDSLYGAR